MGFFTENTEVTEKQIAQEKKAQEDRGSGGINFLKIKPGIDYRIRICPPWSESGEVFRKTSTHWGYKWKGKYRAPVCLDYVFENKNIAEIAAKHQVLTEDDFKLWQKYRCPLDIYYRRLMNMGLKKEARNMRLAPNYRYHFNVLLREDNQVYVLGLPMKAFNSLMHIRSNNPSLFHPTQGIDLSLRSEDKGMREYYFSTCSPSEPLDDSVQDQLVDLDQVFAWGVMDFCRLAAAALNRFDNLKPEDVLGDLANDSIFSVIQGLREEGNETSDAVGF